MKFDTEGTYALTYTATDSCGNSTSENRTVVVKNPPRTVLYPDGTFIINELGEDRASNEALHGIPTTDYVYPILDEDHDYVFENSNQYWKEKMVYIKSVHFGSPIAPTDMKYWFQGATAMEVFDTTNLDTSNNTSFLNTFEECGTSALQLDLTPLDFTSAISTENMFSRCEASVLILGTVNAPNLTNMESMFGTTHATNSLKVDFRNLANLTDAAYAFIGANFSNIEVINFSPMVACSFSDMFNHCTASSIDISGMDFTNATSVNNMFKLCGSLVTILASSNVAIPTDATGSDMFYDSTLLVGGAGTTYSSRRINKTYARIDNPPNAPGYFTLKPSA